MNEPSAYGCYADELPDPPDNPEFEALTEAQRTEFDRRFQSGITLGNNARRFTYLEIEAQRQRNVKRQRAAWDAERAQARADAKVSLEVLERARRRVRK